MLLQNQYWNKNLTQKKKFTQPQNHTNLNANENQGNVYSIMGSNGKFINFKELQSEENSNGSVTLIPLAQ